MLRHNTCTLEAMEKWQILLKKTQVKCQAGYRRDPGNPTQDPRWEWRDPALGGGIPPFPPGMKI